MALPDSDSLSFDGEEIHRCEYEETESYKVTEMFINNRERILELLLG
jgi:predicted ATPase